MIDLHEAAFPDDADAVRAIFREYAASLGVDLGFQNFEEELAGLPGKYAAPAGCVLLAYDGSRQTGDKADDKADDKAGLELGCVAMRALDANTCEMKRLYVRPSARGRGLGRQLAEAICTAAAQAGYHFIRLDTLPTMNDAQGLYDAMGFRQIAAYVFNPVAGTKYMELDLASWLRNRR
ncbi:MAG TPA: GNAT family N-acetyltransferase [Paraburkholderia sp.]|jgi:ribosomal protein S18 acetylase RimI-like enzyme|nr:GNAT family N-acetyltransferase [Paraburkholderia sp.]